MLPMLEAAEWQHSLTILTRKVLSFTKHNSISLFPSYSYSALILCTVFFFVSQSWVLHPCTEFSAESAMERVQCGNEGGLL